MATIVYEEITPTIIENAKVEKCLVDGVHRTYRITPNDGYVLHNKARDYSNLDPDTFEETLVQGFSAHFSTCGAAYAFTPIQMLAPNGATVTAYGEYEFYAILRTEVPADQIFGGVGNDHEVM